jgi:ankyrin repeat protein
MPKQPRHDEPTPARDLRPLPTPSRLQHLLFEAARLGRADMISPLCQAGAHPEVWDQGGYTPLILASYHGSLETTLALLDQGATVDTADLGRGNTALMGVAFKGFAAIVKCLLAAGADVNHRNHAGQSALMMAALFGHAAIVEELIEAGADPYLMDAGGNSATSLARSQGNQAMACLLEMARPGDRGRHG